MRGDEGFGEAFLGAMREMGVVKFGVRARSGY